MTGKGPKHERETIFRFDEESPNVEVFTASEIVYRRMKKNGYYPITEDERHATFVFPRSQFRIPRVPSAARVERGKMLARIRAEKSSARPE